MRLQNYLTGGRAAHLMSVDIRRAFDLAEPRLAALYLERIGVPDSLCQFFVGQLDGSATRIWTAYGWAPEGEMGHDQSWVKVNRGTRQGGVESPLLFLLLVDPILHILERERHATFQDGKVPLRNGPTRWMAGSEAVEFDPRSEEMFLIRPGKPEVAVEKLDWDPYRVGQRGAGALLINDGAHQLQVPLEGAVTLLGNIRGMAEQYEVPFLPDDDVTFRGPQAERDAPGFLGGYADDLMIGHERSPFLKELFRMLERFYRVIGCTISKAKSWWMAVNCDSPVDVAGLRRVEKGGELVYLGFRVCDNGTLRPGKSVIRTFRTAVAMLPGGS
eukprot:gene19795-57223_t